MGSVAEHGGDQLELGLYKLVSSLLAIADITKNIWAINDSFVYFSRRYEWAMFAKSNANVTIKSVVLASRTPINGSFVRTTIDESLYLPSEFQNQWLFNYIFKHL